MVVTETLAVGSNSTRIKAGKKQESRRRPAMESFRSAFHLAQITLNSALAVELHTALRPENPI